MHTAVLPYAESSANRLETLSLFLLTLTSCLVTRYTAPYPESVQIGIFMLIGLPAVLLAAFLLFQKLADSGALPDCLALGRKRLDKGKSVTIGHDLDGEQVDTRDLPLSMQTATTPLLTETEIEGLN